MQHLAAINRFFISFSVSAWVMSLLVFTMPLDKRFTTPLIIISCFAVLVENRFRIRVASFNSFLLLPLILYAAHFAAMINTENSGYGWFDLQSKFSLLIFPLIFFFRRKIKEGESKLIFFSFAAGCFVNAVFSFVKGLNHYQNNQSTLFESFSSYNFSFGLHPAYLSFYTSLCVAYFIFSAVTALKRKSPVHWYFMIGALFFSLITIIHGSKSGIVSLVIIFLFSIAYMFKVKIATKFLAAFAGALLFIALITPVVSPVMSARMKQALAALTIPWKELEEKYKEGKTSSEMRLLLWKTGWDLFRDNPAGVGTGDVKDVLLEKYKSENMKAAYELKLNSHNQFLQTGIALGWAGAFLLLVMFVLPMLIKFKSGDLFSVAFLSIIIFNLAVESMLEKQAGIVFISFFYCLFLSNSNFLKSD